MAELSDLEKAYQAGLRDGYRRAREENRAWASKLADDLQADFAELKAIRAEQEAIRAEREAIRAEREAERGYCRGYRAALDEMEARLHANDSANTERDPGTRLQ